MFASTHLATPVFASIRIVTLVSAYILQTVINNVSCFVHCIMNEVIPVLLLAGLRVMDRQHRESMEPEPFAAMTVSSGTTSGLFFLRPCSSVLTGRVHAMTRYTRDNAIDSTSTHE